MIMTTIAIYPAWENVPAMFSRKLTTDELRGRMGFLGVTITDDLETVAASRFGSLARRARLAANAGNDLLLFAVSYSGGAAAADSLENDVRAGRVSRTRLRESAARILALRAALSP
jgi:beta-N-acetylhexosaminidase